MEFCDNIIASELDNNTIEKKKKRRFDIINFNEKGT